MHAYTCVDVDRDVRQRDSDHRCSTTDLCFEQRSLRPVYFLARWQRDAEEVPVGQTFLAQMTRPETSVKVSQERNVVENQHARCGNGEKVDKQGVRGACG